MADVWGAGEAVDTERDVSVYTFWLINRDLNNENSLTTNLFLLQLQAHPLVFFIQTQRNSVCSLPVHRTSTILHTWKQLLDYPHNCMVCHPPSGNIFIDFSFFGICGHNKQKMYYLPSLSPVLWGSRTMCRNKFPSLQKYIWGENMFEERRSRREKGGTWSMLS